MQNELFEKVLKDADRWLAEGCYAEAAVSYRSVLQRNSALPDAWYNLGISLRHLGQYEASLVSYSEALRHGISEPEAVQVNLACLLSDHLQRPEDAERVLSAALTHRPEYIPALLNLGNLCEQQGRLTHALHAYERCLIADAWNVDALSRYLSLKGISGPGDPWLAKLNDVMEHPNSDSSARMVLGFTLGKLLDEVGDYPAAFSAFQKAHCEYLELLGPSCHRYHRGTEEARIAKIIQDFPAEMAGNHESGLHLPAPIFIVGMFRSGTSLVERVLSGHESVATSGESLLLQTLIADLKGGNPDPARFTAKELKMLAEKYQQRLAVQYPGAIYVTNKRLDNLFNVGFIRRVFPNAKVVVTRRQPLDNCLSIFTIPLDPSYAYAHDLSDIAHQYQQCHRLSEHWLLSGGVHVFDYDAFVRSPESEAKRLIEYCGLEWRDACLDTARSGGLVKSASLWQVRRPIYESSSGRWKNYAPQLVELRAEIGDGFCLRPSEGGESV